MSRPDIPGLVRFAWLKPVAVTMNSKSTFSLEGKVDVSNRLIQLRASRLFLCQLEIPCSPGLCSQE